MANPNLFELWQVFGPIDNPGLYPGLLGWEPLPGDGLAEVPESLIVNSRELKPTTAQMTNHQLDLRAIFPDYPTGSPMCYAFCEFSVNEPTDVILSVDPDWGMVVWLDGKEILDARRGNPSMGYWPIRATAHLSVGSHVLCCRHISGVEGWVLALRAEDAADSKKRPRYSDTAMRMEGRPLPTGMVYGMPTELYERLAATLGVEARWISVFDQSKLQLTGNVLYKSKFLPTGEGFDPEFEPRLKEWVKIIHDQGSSVLTWAAMTQNRQGYLDHPEWRQVFLIPQAQGDTHVGFNVCINSGYGDALINTCIEAIEKFDLDGIYFDGAAYSSVWNLPMPVSCVCEHCNTKYRQQTGNEPPTKYTPETREFREWMLWRYRTFSEYWRRLTRQIKEAHPDATIVMNCYHREHIPWTGAVPLNPFDADILTGTEADGDPWKAAFYTRINRAYGRPYSEVWMSSRAGTHVLDGVKKHNPYPLVTLAVACLTAGGDSSFGAADFSISAAVYSKLAAEIQPRKPFRSLPSLPLAAMHVSQQTDTFSFGTMPEFITPIWRDHYWKSLVGWHRLMMTSGLWMDVVFDDHLKIDVLSKYKYLFMPLAVALSEEQIQTVLEYVRQGGTLLTGPWFGVQDEWGFERKRSEELQKLMPHGNVLPGFAAFQEYLMAAQAQPVSEQVLGAGRIVQYAYDPGTKFRDEPQLCAVEELLDLLRRDAGEVPIRLYAADGGPAYAHIGVSVEKDGSIIVAVQQLEPFWQSPAGEKLSPPLAVGCRLRFSLPDITAAECMVPQPSYPLKVMDQGEYQEVVLPNYTWGTTVRLRFLDSDIK